MKEALANEVGTLEDIPKPVLKPRTINNVVLQEALKAGLSPIMARVVAARPLPSIETLRPKLRNLSTPFNMADMDIAAQRVVDAIVKGECIGIETDHDCDGQSSHAVLFDTLVRHFNHPKEKIRSYIGHRLKEGYGLSDAVADRILQDEPKPNLVITADNGSADELRIARLKAAGIDVIVTDHHEIPKEGCPKSAYACLNPTRKDCQYKDPYIAGCMVAWKLMAATRKLLIDIQHLPEDAPSLMDTLDFVAVGTVADCVSMAKSINNRAVVLFGLKLIEKANRPCWRAIQSLVKGAVSSEDLAFRVGPLLNSDGRLASAFGSVSFLLAETEEEALAWLDNLTEQNNARKDIQHTIFLQGLKRAKTLVQEGRSSLCIYLEDGHTGVHGIVASRIKELYGRPTAFMAPKVGHPEWVSGSIRGIDGFHVRDALQWVDNQHPEIFKAFGGHSGAGGFTLRLENLPQFEEAFEAATKVQLQKKTLGPVILTDGVLDAKSLSLALVEEISSLEPFGREFEQPVFETKAQIQELRSIGNGRHLRVVLKQENHTIPGVWFGARMSEEDPMPVALGEKVKIAFSVKENNFRNNRSVDVHILHMETVV